MTVLVVGSKGYFGTELCQVLKSRGVEVVELNRQEVDTSVAVHSVIRSFKNPFMPKINCLINLAWTGSYGALRDNVEAQEESIKLAVNLARIAKAENIQYISTGTVSELPALNGGSPETLYAVAKYKAFTQIRDLGGDFKWVRLANVFGKKDYTNRFVVNVIKNLLKNEAIEIHTNGEQSFNGVYLTTAAQKFADIIMNDFSNTIEYIIGGTPTTVKEFVTLAAELSGSKSKITFGTKVVPSADAVTLPPDGELTIAICSTIEDTKEIL